MIYMVIPPLWLKESDPSTRALQMDCSFDDILLLNEMGYNVFYYPNYPHIVNDPTKFIVASDVDTFEWVFVDFDLKSGAYDSKDVFIEAVGRFALSPSRIIDSGNGTHVYWRVTDLDAMSFLKLTRRLARYLNTDLAVTQLKQLMRVPGTVNTKDPQHYKLCEELCANDHTYTCEELDKHLPLLTKEDEDFCTNHFNKTYHLDINHSNIAIDEKMPVKFAQLIASSGEAKEIWSGVTDDRSKSDYRLAHLMFANGFTRDEALSVLVNAPKALSRGPSGRVSYAINIVDKIWTFEDVNQKPPSLSMSVKEILSRGEETIKGTRFACWRYLDSTHHGFRLGQVIGLVAGSGVGKTAVALNMFMGFVTENPDYDHFFIPLEQPGNEIADRWRTLCGDKTHLHDKVHIISNYDDNGEFRDLSLSTIQAYITGFQKGGRKVGCVVIDHIGVLANDNKLGQDEGVKKLSKAMKAFAVQTNTMLVMQSQTSREKAGIGDLELNKDAAFGTSVFENFCDYLITVWQPLKRCYDEDGCPTVTAFKFCKIRHKKQGLDQIKEDVPYRLFFDPITEQLRELTQLEEKSFDFFCNKATNKRKLDRKTDIVQYKSLPWSQTPETKGVIDVGQSISVKYHLKTIQ